MDYRGFEIVEKRDFGRYAQDRTGFVIVDSHGCNAAPGAAWFNSVPEAKKGIDNLILANGNSNIWWLLTGHQGLNIEGQVNSKAITVTTPELENTRVVMHDNGEVCLFQSYAVSGEPLTAEQALALANMLTYAAKESLRVTTKEEVLA